MRLLINVLPRDLWTFQGDYDPSSAWTPLFPAISHPLNEMHVVEDILYFLLRSYDKKSAHTEGHAHHFHLFVTTVSPIKYKILHLSAL